MRSCANCFIWFTRPKPTGPTRRSSDKRTASKRRSATGQPSLPSMGSTGWADTPGASAGTRKRPVSKGARLPSTRASTMCMSASSPRLIQRFSPVRSQSSPSRVARVAIAPTSDPAPGSLIAWLTTRRPSFMGLRKRTRWASLPKSAISGATMS